MSTDIQSAYMYIHEQKVTKIACYLGVYVIFLLEISGQGFRSITVVIFVDEEGKRIQNSTTISCF